MSELIRLFYEIALFQKGPQDVPFSRWLTRFSLVVYAAISFLMLFMSNPWFSAVLQMLVDLVLLMMFTRITLAWVHKSERYQQTFCALLGTDALITLCAIPANAVVLIPGNDGMAVLAFFIIIALILWHWAVIGHILSQALSQPLGFSLGIALLYIMVAYQIMNFLFPQINVSG